MDGSGALGTLKRVAAALATMALLLSQAKAESAAIVVPSVGTYPPLTAQGFNDTALPDFGPNFQLVLGPTTCTQNIPGKDVFALSGDFCTAAPGTYNPTTSSAVLPVTDQGFGFFAYDGGIVSSPGAVTINTTGANGSHAAWSDGPGALINLVGGTTVSTIGTNSYGLDASGGGDIIAVMPVSVTTTGDGSIGIHASGAGSAITIGAATISTSGTLAPGVQADSGGAVTLNAGSVSTSGEGSYGLFATGVGSQITATGVAVTTTGGITPSNEFAIGAYGADGAQLSLTDVTISTSGERATGLRVDTGAAANFSGGSVTTTGAGAEGLVALGSGSAIVASGLSITTHGNFDAATSAASNGVYALNGASVTLTDVTITTTGTQANGVVAYAGGTASLTGGSVATSGAGSYGLFADAAGSTIGASGGTAISTAGADAFGVLAASGGGVTLNGGSVTTTGEASWGLYATGAGSQIKATNVSVTTSGAEDAGGNVSLGAYGLSGAQLNLTNVAIATSGPAAHGLEVGSGAIATITGGSVATTGANAFGLFATGAGSSITVKGGTAISTAGVSAPGVFADEGAKISLTGATISTAGVDATGAQAQGGSSITLTGGSVTTSGEAAAGLFATGAGSTVTASAGTTITTHGGFDGSGDQAQGAVATESGAVNLTDTTIVTTGAQGQGVLAATGGTVTMTGGSVTVSGTDADGLLSNGLGSVLSVSGGTTITSSATPDLNSIQGARVDNSGVLNLTDVTISTSGSGTPGVGSPAGVGAATNGTANLQDVTVTTTGEDGHGLFVTGVGSKANLSGTNSFTTSGNGAIGLYATAGGVIAATGQTNVTTSGTASTATGLSAFGVNSDGSGSKINLAGVTVTTTGNGGVGLYASDRSNTGDGGAITVSGAANISTQGAFAYGAWAESPGSTIDLNGSSSFTIGGSAYALYATDGGAIAANSALNIAATGGGGVDANNTGSTISLSGPTTITVGASGFGGLFAAAGGQINAAGQINITTSAAGDVAIVAQDSGSQITLTGGPANLTIQGAKWAGFRAFGGAALTIGGATTVSATGASDVGAEASAGSIVATGVLNITTSDPTSFGVELTGASASIDAAGGGSITSAGVAVTFQNGANLTATFDNFTISNASGDLIFVDPSSGAINLTKTVADAGSGNLLDVTAGSVIALNASGSTLTGAIQTDPTSTTNVSLTNGTVWNVAGDSKMTSLVNNASAITFSSPTGGVFKTVTTGTYVGVGGVLTLNATLGGANSAADQLVINGGSATGTTKLVINNVGGTGGQTTGNGIPIVITINGGTTAANAFQLASTPIVGGYEYLLSRSDSGPTDGDVYLRSQPISTLDDVTNSVAALAVARQSQIITSRILGSILLGANEQVNCSDCASGFAAVGSFDVGTHGRWGLTDRLTLLAGASINQFAANGVVVQSSPTFAASLRYDLVDWGRSRPFFEAGGLVSPDETVRYTRNYVDGPGTATGAGDAMDRSAAVFGRVGFVSRFAPTDEAAAYADLSRNWLQSDGYSEANGSANPFPASFGNGVDSVDIGKIGAQYTHLLASNLEINVNGGVAHSFSGAVGVSADVDTYGAIANVVPRPSTWFEYGARVGYRAAERLTIDAFLLGTLGPEPAGNTIHGGLGLRYAF